MIRVLQIYPQMNNAGTEKVIMNLYKNIDRNKIQFDFLTQKEGELDKQIEELGGKIFRLKPNGKKDYYKKLLNFFKSNKYSIIHVHIQGNMELILKAAKKSNVRCRIIHSHNSRQDLPKILQILKIKRNIEIKKNATDFLACSQEAAKWLFPFNYREAKIVYNAIEIENFKFNSDTRKKNRQQLKIGQEEKVVIYVARFAKQKNHKRFIEISKEILNQNNNIKFLLIGDGPLENNIKSMVKANNIEEKFMFLGNRKNVNELLMAGDLFLFPSLHEGLGIVAIEAQFSGLMCIASDRIPEEADIGLNLLKRIDLKENNKYWCNIILNSLDRKLDREKIQTTYLNNRYNIKKIAKEMEKFYISKAK